MLESVHKQKIALAAYATEHGGITMLNSHHLEIVRKAVLILKPVEEVTKIISKNSACISAVIPLVRILHKMLNKHDDDAGIRTMKSEMLASLESRFDEMEQIEELFVATMLDSRFKHNFFAEAETRLSAKQYLIDNCGYTDDSDEPPNKRPLHDITQDSSDQASSSKVWECFSELLEESGASGDMDGG